MNTNPSKAESCEQTRLNETVLVSRKWQWGKKRRKKNQEERKQKLDKELKGQSICFLWEMFGEVRIFALFSPNSTWLHLT